MSWSYDPAAIEKGLNFVRLMVGDTDTSDQQMSDEEINAILAIEADKWRAAAVVADSISAKYARYGASEAELIEMARHAIPLGGKMLTPDQIARTAVFLASDDANAITGQVVHVNGGSYMP